MSSVRQSQRFLYLFISFPNYFVLLCLWQARISKSYMLFTESICALFSLSLSSDPTAVAQGSCSTRVSWEFISNLNFEYSLISGRRLWRWTAAVSGNFFASFSPPLYQSHYHPGNQWTFVLFFLPTDLHCLSGLYHLPGGHRSRWPEFDLPSKLQGTLFMLASPNRRPVYPSFLQIWMTFSLVCADRCDCRSCGGDPILCC